MENPELIEMLEDELAIVVNKAHKSGLNYWEILKKVQELETALMLQSECEYQQKGGI